MTVAAAPVWAPVVTALELLTRTAWDRSREEAQASPAAELAWVRRALAPAGAALRIGESDQAVSRLPEQAAASSWEQGPQAGRQAGPSQRPSAAVETRQERQAGLRPARLRL